MNTSTALARTTLLALLLGSLSACTVVPTYPSYSSGYAVRPAPVYVETYGSGYYGQPRGNTYYYGNSAPRHGYRHEHYREEPRREYRQEAPRQVAPSRIPSPLQVHRDVRRSLGLPRLPGMP